MGCRIAPNEKAWIQSINWDHSAANPILHKSGFVQTREDIIRKMMPDDVLSPKWGQA